MTFQGVPCVRPTTGAACRLRGLSGSMRMPSYVLLTRLPSNDAPLSASSTSFRHCSCVAAGNSAPSARSSAEPRVMVPECHAGRAEPTASAATMMGWEPLRGLKNSMSRRSSSLIFCRCKALDPGGVQLRQCLPHPYARDHALRGYFGERRQHKRACEQPRMRQRESRLLKCEVVIAENIDIDGARPPPFFFGTLASERTFDCLRARQQMV